MFRQINIMLTRASGAQRHLSVGPLHWTKYSSKTDPQTRGVLLQKKKEKTITTKEASVKSEDGCFSENQSRQFENSKKMSRREALRQMIKEKRKDGNERESFWQNRVAEYGQSPLWRQSLPWVPMPCSREPVIKTMQEKEPTAVDSKIVKDEKKLKLNRRDCLRQIYKENRMYPEGKKTVADMQMGSTKTKKESPDPTRLQFVNLKWKERQQEIEKRMKGTEKKYVSRYELSAGRKEKIK